MTNYQHLKICSLFITGFFVYCLPDGSGNSAYYNSYAETGGGNQLNERSKERIELYRDEIKAADLKKTSSFLKDSLRIKFESLIQSLDAKAGVSLMHIESRDTLNYKGDIHLPMLSVYKFPIAMAVLYQVDKNKLKMEQQIPFAKELIHPGDEDAFSAKNFPGGKATIKDLISLMLVYGSNTACDILLNEMKGPGKVQQYVRQLGIRHMAIANTEKEIQANAGIKYKNWSTTKEMVKLLAIAHGQNVLSKNSYTFLWDNMTATVTGPNRIKGLLPNETKVAHRTGTADNGYNDAGIISLPNGQHLAIAIFIADAKVNPDACNLVIAQISKLANDYYAKQ